MSGRLGAGAPVTQKRALKPGAVLRGPVHAHTACRQPRLWVGRAAAPTPPPAAQPRALGQDAWRGRARRPCRWGSARAVWSGATLTASMRTQLSEAGDLPQVSRKARGRAGPWVGTDRSLCSGTLLIVSFWKALQPAPQSALVKVVAAVRSSRGHGGFVCCLGWGPRGGSTPAPGGRAAFAACLSQEHVSARAVCRWSDLEPAGGCWARACPGPGAGCREGATAALCPGAWGSMATFWPAPGLPAAVTFRAAPAISAHSPGLRNPGGAPFA